MSKSTDRRASKTRSGSGAKAAESTSALVATAFPIVGIGASAGGMESFIELLRQLPASSGMAFVLIQHLDPSHASYLSEALGRATSLPCSVRGHVSKAFCPPTLTLWPSMFDSSSQCTMYREYSSMNAK